MIKVYLANRPPLAEYLNTKVIDQLPVGEVKRIATETGNHWRKIFNVYAKLVYCLAEKTANPLLKQYPSWQAYREQSLLQQGSETELHLEGSFVDSSATSSELNRVSENNSAIHIIMGKAFSERLLADVPGKCGRVEWLDKDFAINRPLKIIVCPYFDYRQLSNIKIDRLAELIVSLQDSHCAANS
ncbi:MAG: hypothetical protein ACI910_000437 [Oleispira sp.]|jgi:hypothetical protein